VDILGALRAGATEDELLAYLGRVWRGRLDRYSDERAELLGAMKPAEKSK